MLYKRVKIVAVLLVVSMILSVSLLFTSCGRLSYNDLKGNYVLVSVTTSYSLPFSSHEITVILLFLGSIVSIVTGIVFLSHYSKK